MIPYIICGLITLLLIFSFCIGFIKGINWAGRRLRGILTPAEKRSIFKRLEATRIMGVKL